MISHYRQKSVRAFKFPKRTTNQTKQPTKMSTVNDDKVLQEAKPAAVVSQVLVNQEEPSRAEGPVTGPGPSAQGEENQEGEDGWVEEEILIEDLSLVLSEGEEEGERSEEGADVSIDSIDLLLMDSEDEDSNDDWDDEQEEESVRRQDLIRMISHELLSLENWEVEE